MCEGARDPVNKSACDCKVAVTGSAISLLLTLRCPADSTGRTVYELGKRRIAASLVAGIDGGGMQRLDVYRGSRHVVVTVLLLGIPEAKAKAAALAVMNKALTRVK